MLAVLHQTRLHHQIADRIRQVFGLVILSHLFLRQKEVAEEISENITTRNPAYEGHLGQSLVLGAAARRQDFLTRSSTQLAQMMVNIPHEKTVKRFFGTVCQMAMTMGSCDCRDFLHARKKRTPRRFWQGSEKLRPVFLTTMNEQIEEMMHSKARPAEMISFLQERIEMAFFQGYENVMNRRLAAARRLGISR